MAAPTKLTTAQIRAISQATSGLLDAQQQKAVIAAIDAATSVAATTTAAGTVLKGAAVANCTVAADGTSAGTQLNALLVVLRANGTIAT